MRISRFSVLTLGALMVSAPIAMAEPVKLSSGAMDSVTAGMQTGNPFGTAVVAPAQQGRDIPGAVVSAFAKNGGLGSIQTGQIQRPNIKGEAFANGLN